MPKCMIVLAALIACDALAAPAPYRVAQYDVDWVDAARHRPVAARIYAPADAPGPLPVIVFSHGLGNSRLGYAWLGRYWASQGFVSIHPEHVGADLDVAQHGLWHLYRAGFDRANWRDVPLDIRFVLDQIARDDALPQPLRGRLDLAYIGVAGHSLGAFAALAVGGMRVDGVSYRDERVRAAVPISMSEAMPAEAYESVAIPMLHITGTRDASYAYGTTPRARRVPFESIPRDDQILVTIAGANHSTPSDDESPANRAAHDIIRNVTTAFWNAYLRGTRLQLPLPARGERVAEGRVRGALYTIETRTAPLRVGKITVVAGNLFDGRANALHVQTRESLVRDFLLFREGERFDEARLHESERNLRALDFLRSASIVAAPPHDSVVDVTVTTEDAFTTDVNADFSNDGRRSLYDFDVTQKDLGGSGAEADVRVANGRERSTRSLEILDPRLAGAYWNGDAMLARSSDGNEEKLAIERPLYSYAAPYTAAASFDHLLQDARVYEDGAVAALFREEHREATLAYGRALAATPQSSLRLVGGVDLLSDTFTALHGLAPLDRHFRFFEAGLDSQSFDLFKLDHVDLGLREQDFNLGVHTSVYAARAAGGALRFRSDDSAGYAFGPHAFVLTRLSASARGRSTNRNSVTSSDTRYVYRFDTAHPQTFVVRARLDYGSDADRDVQFFAGGQNGLRAYPNFAFSGPHRVVVNAEQRLFLGTEWLHLLEPGFAVFVDSGDAAANALFRHFKSDAGAGLRFAVSRFESTMIRVDAAYAFNGSPLSRRGLVFSIATTQAF